MVEVDIFKCNVVQVMKIKYGKSQLVRKCGWSSKMKKNYCFDQRWKNMYIKSPPVEEDEIEKEKDEKLI